MKSQIGILGEDAFTAVIDAVIIVLQSGSFSNGPLIQMWRYIEGLRWFLLTLLPLIFLQRALHHELQVVLVLLIRRVDIALVVFSLLFLPGVLLHEVSHFIAAKLLRVPTRGFSLVPRRLDDGRLLMGYVETAPTDFIRDALIGAAPFLAGGLFVAYTGRIRLGLLSLWMGVASGELPIAIESLRAAMSRPDFWLWFYLTITVSSTMLPSSSDRRAWLSLGIVIALLVGTMVFAGVGPWMLHTLTPLLNDVLRSTSVVLAMSAAVHLVVLIPTLLIRRVLSQITGLDVMV